MKLVNHRSAGRTTMDPPRSDRGSRSPDASSAGGITELLRAWAGGSEDAEARLFALLHPVLQALAAARLAEVPPVSLQPTEIVHEAYLRLREQAEVQWQDRTHFIAVSAIVVRRVLVDHLRRRQSLKRGGRALHLSIDEIADLPLAAPQRHPDLLALDDALDRLAKIDPVAVRLVELRYFGGLGIDQAAVALSMGRTRAVETWRAARAWLLEALRSGAGGA